MPKGSAASDGRRGVVDRQNPSFDRVGSDRRSSQRSVGRRLVRTCGRGVLWCPPCLLLWASGSKHVWTLRFSGDLLWTGQVHDKRRFDVVSFYCEMARYFHHLLSYLLYIIYHIALSSGVLGCEM